MKATLGVLCETLADVSNDHGIDDNVVEDIELRIPRNRGGFVVVEIYDGEIEVHVTDG